jgi:tripartite-type tricarboxylate transporter receptor subunit TctC
MSKVEGLDNPTPTFAESGFPDIDITSWIAIFGPAGIPGPVLEVLAAAFGRAMADAGVQARLVCGRCVL